MQTQALVNVVFSKWKDVFIFLIKSENLAAKKRTDGKKHPD